MNLYEYATLILIEIQHVIPFGDYMFLIETIAGISISESQTYGVMYVCCVYVLLEMVCKNVKYHGMVKDLFK